MTTTEIVVIIAGLVIGYWMVANFLKGKADPPPANSSGQVGIATASTSDTTHGDGDKPSLGNFGETKENQPPIPTIAEQATEKRRGEHANYFVRHWRGELSLGVAYWVNGALIVGVFSATLTALVNEMNRNSESLRTIAIASAGVLVLTVSCWLWSVVGIWRSAEGHVQRGGRQGWATVAKIMVVIGALGMAATLSDSVFPQLRELSLIAFGRDPIGKVDIKVAADGRSIVVFGALGEGSADDVQRIMDAAPAATTIVFNSRGGRLIEAQKLARGIRTRGLDTYVENLCASACTFAFLAGRDRAATPNARIGFHQPSFVGMDSSAQQAATQEMMAVYRSAGLPDDFIQRIANTSPEHMWYPTRDELIEARVVTRYLPKAPD